MTKAMEEARAILKDINVHPITHAPRLLDRIAAALAARDAEIERLREALTPSGATKAAYIGEFFEQVEVGNPDFEDDEDAPETVMQAVPVSWTTIKEIMAAIARRALTAGGQHG